MTAETRPRATDLATAGRLRLDDATRRVLDSYAAFSPELADLTIYVIDVSAGDKIPRKGGPGITRSDLLVINKTDLAPLVGADLSVMDRDARRMRGMRPFVFTNLKADQGVEEIAAFVLEAGGLARTGSAVPYVEPQ